MKKLYYYLLLFTTLGFILTSCDDENNEIKLKSNDGEIISSVSISSFRSFHINVENAIESFSVKSDNEDIASISIYYCVFPVTDFSIHAHKPGTTIITVTDNENRTAQLMVTVEEENLDLTITEHLIDVETETETEIVTETDKEKIEEIKKEISEKLIPEGGRFVMTYTSQNGGTIVYYPNAENTQEKTEGTFETRIGEGDEYGRFIAFIYSGKKHEYRMDKVDTEETPPVYYLYLTLDLSDYYKNMDALKISKAEGQLKIRINK